MTSQNQILKEIKEAREACQKALKSLKFRSDEREHQKKLSALHYSAKQSLLELDITHEEKKLREEIEELRKTLSAEHLQEELIKRLAEVEARETMVYEREVNVVIDENQVKEENKKLNKLYDDCIAIATKEAIKVKDEMIIAHCEKLKEIEELLEVVRVTDAPQFQLELFEQLREVSPFTYKVKSVADFVEIPKSESDSNKPRTKKVTELDNISNELDKRENELALEAARLEELRQQLMSASTKRQTATRSKYKLEEVPAYKARANELKAERSLPWKEWTKTDAGREYLRLSSAVRRLEKV